MTNGKGRFEWAAALLVAGTASVSALAAPGSEFRFNAALNGGLRDFQATALSTVKICGAVGSAARSAAPGSEEAALEALSEKQAGISARFVPIEPGTFIMGSPVGQGYNNEVLHQVTLTQGYEMQAAPVTQLQYLFVMGSNPSRFRKESDCGKEAHETIAGIEACAASPVEDVSWDDAQQFIARLNAVQSDHIYRLPTEAEWEKAAKADGGEQGGSWIDAHKSPFGTYPVAALAPNALGLYDMLDDVWEWTLDFYAEYSKDAVIDPQGPPAGSSRVVRGGCLNYYEGSAHPAYRFPGDPGRRYNRVGLRLVRVPRN